MRRSAGFTLIELMIASALVLVVTVFTMQVFTANNRTYTNIDSVAEAQQSMRVVATTIERDLRHAGMMVHESSAVCAVDDDAGPDLLYVSDHEAIDTDALIAPLDGADITSASGSFSTGASVTLTVDDLVLEPGPTIEAAYDVDGDGTNDSDFQPLGGVIVIDRDDPSRGSACGRITGVNLGGDQVTFTLATSALGGVVGTPDLIAVPAIEYRVAGDRLFRNGLRLTDGVEDLQLAFFADLNGDSLVDPGEVRGDGTGADYDASAIDASDLREIRFNLVVRSRSEDDEFTQGYFQATENRDAVAGTDGFRRRVHTSTVRLRNVGIRMAV